jgi:hypothetical protein
MAHDGPGPAFSDATAPSPKAGGGALTDAQHYALKPLTLDVELYQAYLDDPSLSDADRQELCAALWSVVTSFVDLGFGIHPLQQATRSAASEPCGSNNPIKQIAAAITPPDVVASKSCETKSNQDSEAS